MKFQPRRLLPVTVLGPVGGSVPTVTRKERADPASHVFRSLALGLACLAAMAPFYARADFSGLGDVPGGGFASYATAVSADGTTVVGSGLTADATGATTEGFIWTASGGLQSLGIPKSSATGVSADGGTVVGYFYNTDHTEAFRWTAAMLSLYRHDQEQGRNAPGCRCFVMTEGAR